MQLCAGIIITALFLVPAAAAAESSANAETNTETVSTSVSTQVEAPQAEMSDLLPEASASPDTETYRTILLDATSLDLRYAGTVSATGAGQALALVFTDGFREDDDFSSYIMVIDEAGRHVGGRWHVADDPRVLFFPVADVGEYRVILTPGLSDQDGDLLRVRYHGTIEVVR